MTEAELQKEVIARARACGLYVFHSTDATRDIGPGFTDLVIVGPGGVAFVELKSSYGYLRYEQKDVRRRLIEAGATYLLWTPQELREGTVDEWLEYLSTPEPMAA